MNTTTIVTVSMGTQEVFALWVVTEARKGGFAFSVTDIALVSSICGDLMSLVQLLLFPKFVRRVGARKAFRAAVCIMAVAYAALPFTAPIDSGTEGGTAPAFVLLTAVYAAVQSTNSMAMTVTGMLVANSALMVRTSPGRLGGLAFPWRIDHLLV
jgi:hypothetical protein